MLVDSHCHLDRIDLEKTGGDLDDLLAAARERGISRFLSVAVDLASSRRMIDLAARYPDVVVSVGAHPLQDHPLEEQALPVPPVDELVALATEPGVVAIGETGLDNHYGSDSTDWQKASFINHMEAASAARKPVIVHTRQARQETLAILRDHGGADVGGVLHCFTESWEMAKAAMDMGFYISFSGIVTFNSAGDLREVVRKMPLDRLLVETDSPWLAPVPHRGRQNEPRYVREVAEKVAELKGLDLEELAAITSRNFEHLFLSGAQSGAQSGALAGH